MLIARHEEIEWVRFEGVYEIVPMQECKEAGKKLLELNLGGHRQVCGSASQEKIDRDWVPGNTRNRSKARFKEPYLLQLFSAVPPLEAVKALVSIMMSVSWSNAGKPWKFRHDGISRAHVQGTAQRLVYVRLPAGDRQKHGEDKVDASHIWQLDYVTLICGELGGFRRGKHSAALFHNSNEDVRMAVHDDDFVCLSDDGGLKTHRQTSQIPIHSERHGNTWFRRFRCEKYSVVDPCD